VECDGRTSYLAPPPRSYLLRPHFPLSCFYPPLLSPASPLFLPPACPVPDPLQLCSSPCYSRRAGAPSARCTARRASCGWGSGACVRPQWRRCCGGAPSATSRKPRRRPRRPTAGGPELGAGAASADDGAQVGGQHMPAQQPRQPGTGGGMMQQAGRGHAAQMSVQPQGQSLSLPDSSGALSLSSLSAHGPPVPALHAAANSSTTQGVPGRATSAALHPLDAHLPSLPGSSHPLGGPGSGDTTRARARGSCQGVASGPRLPLPSHPSAASAASLAAFAASGGARMGPTGGAAQATGGPRGRGQSPAGQGGIILGDQPTGTPEGTWGKGLTWAVGPRRKARGGHDGSRRAHGAPGAVRRGGTSRGPPAAEAGRAPSAARRHGRPVAAWAGGAGVGDAMGQPGGRRAKRRSSRRWGWAWGWGWVWA